MRPYFQHIPLSTEYDAQEQWSLAAQGFFLILLVVASEGCIRQVPLLSVHRIHHLEVQFWGKL